MNSYEMPNPMGKGCLIVSFKSSSPLNEYPEVSLYNLTFYSLHHIHFSGRSSGSNVSSPSDFSDLVLRSSHSCDLIFL